MAIDLLLGGTGCSYRRDGGKFMIAPSEPAGKGKGTISGSLIEASRLRPIADALVRVQRTDIKPATDAQGNFRLTGVPAGYHVVWVSPETIRPATIVRVVAAPNETTHFDPLEIPIPKADGSLEMKELVVDATTLGGALRIESMEVSSAKVTGIIPREKNQAVRHQVFSRDDIDRTGVTSVPEL